MIQVLIQAGLFFASIVFVIAGLGIKAAGDTEGDPTQIAIGYGALGIGVLFALLGFFGPTKKRRDSN